MTQDEIIRMAREAGIGALTDYGKEALERFAALVAANEREKLKTPRMTLDEIKKLGGHRPMTPWVVSVVIEAMAIEREACAKVCEELINEETCYVWIPDAKGAVNKCAAAIRSRCSQGARG